MARLAARLGWTALSAAYENLVAEYVRVLPPESR
jgi:hypothetical protein